MSERARAGGRSSRTDPRRRKRPRPTPSWLMEQKDLDEIARRRCLMVLRVLSGEQPVTEAIAEAKVSRGTYYKLETAALKAMLAALAPGASLDITAAADGATRKIAELEEKVKKLEQERRRADRLWLLTKKLVKPGALKTAAGRPPGSRNRSSTRSGTSGSAGSRGKKTTSSPAAESSTIHRPDGAGGPSSGIAS